jgi:cytochrome c553
MSTAHHKPSASSAAMLALGLLLAPPAWPGQPLTQSLSACVLCHGSTGISHSAEVPNLAGQKARYLVLQLRAFRAGERKNELMNALAAQLDEAEIEALALHWSRLPAMPAPAVTAAPADQLPSVMNFPAAFPAGFRIYEQLQEGGHTTRRWANDEAWAAAASGRPLPDGSVIVVSEHDSPAGPDGKPVPGPARSFAAMEARAGWGERVPALLRNGNWDYALFSGQRVRNDGARTAECLACHQPIAAQSHVFTLPRLLAAAGPPLSTSGPTPVPTPVPAPASKPASPAAASAPARS